MDTNIGKLIDKLRSDQYRQWTGALKIVRDNDPPCYCVMGVACEVAKEDGVEIPLEFKRERDCIEWDFERVKFFSWVVPDQLLAYYGLTQAQACSLVKLNDDYGLNFEELACVLEAHLDGLKVLD